MMGKDESRASAALAQIAEMATAGGDFDFGCRVKSLPERLRQKAAEVATKVNPVNAPLHELISGRPGLPRVQRLVVETAKYWGPTPRQLTVSFMESTPADLRVRIVSHMNSWTATGCISFAETSGTGQVRISRGSGGFFSYLGTDILLIPPNRQTMNLEAFTMSTDESEYRRVIRHETGHTLGFPHEHLRRELVIRINPVQAYRYFLATQGWDKQMVDDQVLTPLDDASIFGTPPDEDSIMCYQLPGQITFDGLPIRGGTDINASDFAFAGLVYPKSPFSSATDSASQYAASRYADEWAESEDVLEPV